MCQYSISIAITEILNILNLRHFSGLQDFLQCYNKILFINVFTAYISNTSVQSILIAVALHWLDSTAVKPMIFFSLDRNHPQLTFFFRIIKSEGVIYFFFFFTLFESAMDRAQMLTTGNTTTQYASGPQLSKMSLGLEKLVNQMFRCS